MSILAAVAGAALVFDSVFAVSHYNLMKERLGAAYPNLNINYIIAAESVVGVGLLFSLFFSF